MYQVQDPSPRVGLRFTSGLLDLHLIKVADSIETRLEALLTERQETSSALPAAWRVAVSDLRGLLEDVQQVLEVADESFDYDSSSFVEDRKALFERVFEKWAPAFYGQQELLFRLSEELEEKTRERAQAFASREIMPLVYLSPMYRRAFDKPLGYAGDYRLIEMYFEDLYSGKTLFAQFLQLLAQRYPLGKTVRDRESLMRSKVSRTIRRRDNPRIVALACGPALELKNVILELASGEHSCEFVFVDQDEQAMNFAHSSLSRSLMGVGQAAQLAYRLNGLHISVKQILKPADDGEAEFVRSALGEADLIYAAGLYDYLPQPVATALTQRLYGLLAPGGELFVGNLKRCPVSTWIMEYVLAWHLQYRTESDMEALALALRPTPSTYRLSVDAMDRCVFLEVHRPE